MLTTTIFIAIFFGTLSLIFGLLIPLFLIPIKNDIASIRESVKPLKQIEDEARRLGLHEYFKSLFKTEEHHSLPPEKARRKEELLSRGRLYGLDPYEADELKRLLNEEAQNDFVAGLIGTVAVIALIVLIAAFVNSLVKK